MQLTKMIALILILATTGVASASDSALTGKWMIESVKDIDSVDSSKTELVVLEDGGVAMTVGCNRMRGNPTIEGSMIEFGPIAGTLMACPEPLDLLEKQFQEALEATRSYAIEPSGKVLVFFDADGEPLIRLVRPE